MTTHCPYCGSTPCYVGFIGSNVECSNSNCEKYSPNLYPPPCFTDMSDLDGKEKEEGGEEEKTDPGISNSSLNYNDIGCDDVSDSTSVITIPDEISGTD